MFFHFNRLVEVSKLWQRYFVILASRAGKKISNYGETFCSKNCVNVNVFYSIALSLSLHPEKRGGRVSEIHGGGKYFGARTVRDLWRSYVYRQEHRSSGAVGSVESVEYKL